MTRELRISFIFILVYFIFGLSSLISLGDFVTPYFFSKLSLVLLSCIFLVLNIRSNYLFFYIIALFAMLSRAIVDDFSLYYIAEKFNSLALIEWGNKTSVIYFSFAIFYMFYLLAIYLLWKGKLNRFLIAYFLILIIGSIWALSLGCFVLWELLLALFLLSYFSVSRYVLNTENTVVNAYASLFIFQVAVESMKYFYV